MKKIFLALITALVTIGAIAPVYANDHDHHRVCHKVRVHHHWETRCH
jgi:hypothetical protein